MSKPTSQPAGTGGLKYDATKRARANEWNIFAALVFIVIVFEI